MEGKLSKIQSHLTRKLQRWRVESRDSNEPKYLLFCSLLTVAEAIAAALSFFCGGNEQRTTGCLAEWQVTMYIETLL